MTRTRCEKYIGAALAASGLCVTAHAETSGGIGLSASTDYNSNPFLLNTADASAIVGRVSISPYVEEKTARSALRVASSATYSAYNRRYRDAVDLSTQIGYRNSLSRQFSVRAGVSLNSSVGGSYNVVPIFAAASPDPIGVPPIIDITVIGFQQRSSQAQGSAGLTYAINDKNTLSLDYDAAAVRYPGRVNRAEYSSVGQSVSYSRIMNSRMSAGASVNVSKVNYLRTSLGDAVIISPSVNGRWQVNARWTVAAGLGVSHSRVNVAFGRLNSTSLSGNFNLCRNDVRTKMCVNASRNTSASSFEGPRTSTSVGASYSYRFTPRNSISASGGYSRSRATVTSANSRSVDYLSARATWSRQFGERLSGNISGGFSRSGFLETRSNAYASIGVSYNFGQR